MRNLPDIKNEHVLGGWWANLLNTFQRKIRKATIMASGARKLKVHDEDIAYGMAVYVMDTDEVDKGLVDDGTTYYDGVSVTKTTTAADGHINIKTIGDCDALFEAELHGVAAGLPFYLSATPGYFTITQGDYCAAGIILDASDYDHDLGGLCRVILRKAPCQIGRGPL